MTRLLQIYFSICLLQRGPQDLPASRTLLYGSVAVYAAVVSMYNVREGIGWYALPMTLLSLLTVWALYTSLLRLNEKEARTTQTLSAVYGSSGIVSLLAAPIQWPLVDAIKAKATPSPEASLLILIIMIWSLLIDAHIIRHALDSTLARGFLIAVAMAVAALLILSTVRASLPLP